MNKKERILEAILFLKGIIVVLNQNNVYINVDSARALIVHSCENCDRIKTDVRKRNSKNKVSHINFANHRMLKAYKYIFGVIVVWVLILSFSACKGRKDERVITPWGEVTDSVAGGDDFDLTQIVANGELIMLTVSGPDTYYDYHGRPLGVQYMLCQKFAEKLGVSLRVEVCRDTSEMVRKLEADEADIIATPLPRNLYKQLPASKVGTDSIGYWRVSAGKPELGKAIDSWYKNKMMGEVKREEAFLLSSRSVVRHVYAPMLNRTSGVISHYDHLFMTYSMPIRWDWRLMAAQCYQESTFDPNAKSWAGALGLMQIMPSTAAHLGLPMEKIHDPESNIAAAAKYLGELEAKFGDIPARAEKMNFALASYNGGYHHIRDAMALARKDGKGAQRWDEVAEYVLRLSQPQYYRDPVVKYGYMRGAETVGYVSSIRKRWESYRGVRAPRVGVQGASPHSVNPGGMIPRRATHHKKKYTI